MTYTKYLNRGVLSLLFIISALVLTSGKLNQVKKTQIEIRINQVGYLPGDIKKGVILSNKIIVNKKFAVRDLDSKKIAFEGDITKSELSMGSFANNYVFDFTALTLPGKYIVELNNFKSFNFKIGNNIYNEVTDTLMQFYKVQRCGYTNPLLHKVCHISDATRLIDGVKEINKQIDVTGGWHDAGDYVKFMNTTAVTTYMLLFAYDFDPIKFGFDSDGDGTPDILAEAKIGLDWMHRASVDKKLFVTQVQGLNDHDVGWRLPEDDPLAFDRPAYLGIGKNLIGIYTAAMSLGSRIWRNRFQYDEYADKCLTAAENYYSIRNEVPDIDTSGSGMYLDSGFNGKLALGAIELFIASRRRNLLDEAKNYATKAGSDYWWSYGDINSLAQYKIGMYDTSFVNYLRQNLEHFKQFSSQKLFSEGADYSWGTNNTLMGVALQVILYNNLTKSDEYLDIEFAQRDYVLGKNPWGVSFISKIGKKYTKNFHHQISYLKKTHLPGGFAAGPIKKNVYNDYDITFASADRFRGFQPDSAAYYDDRMDYLSNEPTIVANATAVFVMGYFSSKR